MCIESRCEYARDRTTTSDTYSVQPLKPFVYLQNNGISRLTCSLKFALQTYTLHTYTQCYVQIRKCCTLVKNGNGCVCHTIHIHILSHLIKSTNIYPSTLFALLTYIRHKMSGSRMKCRKMCMKYNKK